MVESDVACLRSSWCSNLDGLRLKLVTWLVWLLIQLICFRRWYPNCQPIPANESPWIPIGMRSIVVANLSIFTCLYILLNVDNEEQTITPIDLKYFRVSNDSLICTFDYSLLVLDWSLSVYALCPYSIGLSKSQCNEHEEPGRRSAPKPLILFKCHGRIGLVKRNFYLVSTGWVKNGTMCLGGPFYSCFQDCTSTFLPSISHFISHWLAIYKSLTLQSCLWLVIYRRSLFRLYWAVLESIRV